MVISLNPEPNKQVFQSLLDNTISTLDVESKRIKNGILIYQSNTGELRLNINLMIGFDWLSKTRGHQCHFILKRI